MDLNDSMMELSLQGELALKTGEGHRQHCMKTSISLENMDLHKCTYRLPLSSAQESPGPGTLEGELALKTEGGCP